MMRNTFLDVRTARDIDAVVAKILRGLGNPEPPLILDDVRALQQLDRQYYSSVDDGPLREFVSRAYIGAKQVLLRPTLILEIVRKRSLKALYLPDRKRILIDSSEPKLKWRWNESHEIIHDGVPWHQDAMFGDTEHTLRIPVMSISDPEGKRSVFLRSRSVSERSDAGEGDCDWK